MSTPRQNTKKETKMAANAQTAQADFAATFAAFKQANDLRLTEIEQKNQSDILLDEKIAKLNTALDQQSRHIEKMRVKSARPFMQMDNQTIDQTEEKSAWSRYIRTGDAGSLLSLDSKSANTAVDAEGGYIAPAQTQTNIERVLAESSAFRSIATVRQVGVASYKKPISAGGANAGWAGETDARPETTAPQLELLDFPVGELYAMPAATQLLLDDSMADVDQWLAEEVRDVFAVQETAAFTSGNGVNKPKGILSYTAVAENAHSWGNLGYIASGADGDFDLSNPIDALIDLTYAPKSQYRPNASFVMNRRTLGVLRKFKDADGNYIWQPSSQAGQPSSLLGYPVVEVEDMPDMASDTTPIAFGDFGRGYLIVDRQSVRVLRDPYSAKPYVLFYTTKRVGGGVQDFNAIKLLKLSQN